MKFLVCLSLLFCSLHVLAQDSIIAEKDYYTPFSTIPNPSAETHFVLQSEVIPFDFVYNRNNDRRIFDTIFTRNDTAFIKKQADKAEHFTWAPGMIFGTTVGVKSDLQDIVNRGWDNFERMFGCSEYWAYSVPLYSADKNTCVVKYINYVSMGSPWGIVYYYKKTNGKWKAIYHYKTWVREQ